MQFVQFVKRYISRKFLLTIGIMYMIVMLPEQFKKLGVSDNITLAAMAILGGIGAAYGFVNIKDNKQ